MKHLLAQIILFSLTITLTAQNPVIIQNDPSVVIGKTNNGLTYYLINNAASSKGFADFMMVQRWGTSVENTSEKGMTSLLAGMNLIESRGFPDGTMFSALGSLGISLDNSLVFQVNAGNVLMGLKKVPTASSTAADAVLSALINMCSGAELNSETLNSGRSFHYHNTARYQTLHDRECVDLIKSLYPDNPRLTNDIEEEIDNLYRADALQIWDFQKKWFRPAAQALVIVGDIDVNAMKSKIALISHTLPKGEQTISPSFSIEFENGAESFHTYIDREADAAHITVDFIKHSLKPGERNTAIALVQNYINSLLCRIIKSRISNLSKGASFPFFSYDVKTGGFCGINDTEALSIQMSTDPTDVEDAVSFLSSLLESLKKGVTSSEFNSATEWCRKQAADRPDFTEGTIHHFLTGYPVPSVKDKTEYAAKLQNTFTDDKMNAYLASYLEDDTYRVIHCVSPMDISDDVIHDAFSRGKSIELTPEQPSGIPQQSVASQVKLKNPVTEPITGSLTYTLPNFSRVFFKKNSSEPGKVSILAVAKGGFSMADKSYVYLSRYMNGISELTVPAIPDSKDIDLHREFTPDRAYLKGSCRTEDLETLFKMINESFTGCRVDEQSFDKKLKELTLQDVYGFNSPEYRLNELSSEYLLPKKDYSSLDWMAVTRFLNQNCFNIGSYTFLISGDCPENVMKEYIERYLAPIQGKRNTLSAHSGLFTPEPTGQDIKESITMEQPRHLLSFRLTGEVPYSLAGIMSANVISTLIRQKISETMFEEGILSESTQDVIRYPRNLLSFEFRLSSPDDLSCYSDILNATLDDLEENGLTYDRIEAAKRFVLSSFARSEASGNDFWINMMEARLNGKDFISQREATMSAISADEINTSLKNFIASASRKTVRIIPKEIEIPEMGDIEFTDPSPQPLDMTFDFNSFIGIPVPEEIPEENIQEPYEELLESEEPLTSIIQTEDVITEKKDTVLTISDISDK